MSRQTLNVALPNPSLNVFFMFKKTHRPLKPHKTSLCDAICSIFHMEVKVVYEACVRGALKHCHESCERVSKAWTVKTNISILGPILTKPHEKLLFWWEFLVEGRSEWDTTVPLAGKASDYQITNVTTYKFTVADSRLRYIGPTNQTNSWQMFVTLNPDQSCSLCLHFSLFSHSMVL